MDVVVQPSVPWMSLNDQIKDSGLFFPVDPGPSVSDALGNYRRASVLSRVVTRISLITRTG
jgi:FAD/FMN-containing dehydrogenase